MAPEQVEQIRYGKTIDWWAVGILLYELLIGISPFRIGNAKMSQEAYEQKVLNKSVSFPDREKYKIKYTDELKDLILGLLNKDPTKRLGAKNDHLEIKEHPVFKSVVWDDIINRKVEATIKPIIKEDLTKKLYFGEQMQPQASYKEKKLLKKVEKKFKPFSI